MLEEREEVEFGNKILKIIVGGMKRKEENRNIIKKMIEEICKSDEKRRGRRKGIIEEKLVEIENEIEKERIKIRRIDIDILINNGSKEKRRIRKGVLKRLRIFILKIRLNVKKINLLIEK